MNVTDLTPRELGDVGHVQITADSTNGVFLAEVWTLPGDAREGYSAEGSGRASTIGEALTLAVEEYSRYHD